MSIVTTECVVSHSYRSNLFFYFFPVRRSIIVVVIEEMKSASGLDCNTKIKSRTPSRDRLVHITTEYATFNAISNQSLSTGLQLLML